MVPDWLCYWRRVPTDLLWPHYWCGTPTDLLWSKNIKSLTRGPNWPFRCLDDGVVPKLRKKLTQLTRSFSYIKSFLKKWFCWLKLAFLFWHWKLYIKGLFETFSSSQSEFCRDIATQHCCMESALENVWYNDAGEDDPQRVKLREILGRI